MQQVSHGPLSYSVDPLCAMHPMLQGRVATANNTARARNPAGAESTTLHYFYDPSLFYAVAPPCLLVIAWFQGTCGGLSVLNLNRPAPYLE
jgi:hypothetical protein